MSNKPHKAEKKITKISAQPSKETTSSNEVMNHKKPTERHDQDQLEAPKNQQSSASLADSKSKSPTSARETDENKLKKRGEEKKLPQNQTAETDNSSKSKEDKSTAASSSSKSIKVDLDSAEESAAATNAKDPKTKVDTKAKAAGLAEPDDKKTPSDKPKKAQSSAISETESEPSTAEHKKANAGSDSKNKKETDEPQLGTINHRRIERDPAKTIKSILADSDQSAPNSALSTRRALGSSEIKDPKRRKSNSSRDRQDPNAEKPLREVFILVRPFVALGRYLRDSWRELRQVRWPNRKVTWKMTLAVIIYCAIFIVFITLLDTFFTFIFNLLLG